MSKKLKTPLKSRVSALAVASCLGAAPMMADAAGLGRITVFSALGQPLRAEIEVNANKDELPGMAARIASPESFRQAGLEYASALSSIKVAMEKRPSGQPVIRLSSDRPVSDPFIDMLLELNWTSGRLVREYTFLLDPPEMLREASSGAPVAAMPAVAEKPAEPAPGKVAEKLAEKAAMKPAEKPAEKPVEKPAEKPLGKVDKKLAKPEKQEKSAVEAKPPVASSPAAERTVKSGDTLSKIAGEVKPEGVALEQMLVGLFRANPDAFQGNNMNRLKSGRILTIPDQEVLEGVSVPAARKEVLAQASDWNAYRRKLAGVTAQEPAAEKPAQKESGGKITAKVEEKAAPSSKTQDQVKVSKTEAANAQAPAVKKSSAEEEKIAREKALKESAERAAQLEKNVADLQKLADIKNKQLAQAQAAAKAPEPAPVAKAVEPAKPAVLEAPKPAPAPAPVAETKPAETKPAEAPIPEAAKPEVAKMPDAPKPKPKPIAEPEEEDEGMGAGVWGGLAALLAGVGGLFYYRRKKAGQAGGAAVVPPSLSDASLGANSVFRATGGQSVDTSAATPAVTDFSQTGPGTIDTDEVDPVAEAEVYMAYGRDAQAEEILLEALQKDGKRLAIHLKLLEIYAQRKSAKQFETLATELYTQTGGAGPEWEKAAAMGVKLDPANPLYTSAGTTAAPFGAASFSPDSTLVVHAAGAAGKDSAAAAIASFDQLDVPTPEAVTAEADKTVSFDLNIGDLPDFGNAPPAQPFASSETLVRGVATPMERPPAEDTFALDFDLDLGSAPVATSAPVAPDQSFASATLVDHVAESLSVAADALSMPPALAEPLATAKPDIDFGNEGLEFDLKFDDADVAPGALDTAIAPTAPENRVDLSTISLDLNEPAEPGLLDLERTMLATPETADALATNFVGAMGTMPVAPAELLASMTADAASPEEQAVATKLDLAKAYEEMGDNEGARELLQEVLAEGSATQKKAAEEILARLG